ncbi:MAG: 3-oxoacyl-ACP synthase III [Pirellulales bacterium]|nr:3-oxoacyl-ACP synthase III [Pirellulales bacterium]
MRYQNVCLEAIAYLLPDEIVASEEIETRLEPLYARLRLPQGRLELMTGIRERRFWPPGTSMSEPSILSAERAIALSGIEKQHIGALLHGSVCRDFLEPATACGVHHALGLPRECAVYDLSNACLGLLNGAVQIANAIELGQIRAGVVVGTESSRALVENTIHQLNSDASLSRNDIKLSVASLTIGSGSAAIVLCHKDLSRTGNRLLGGAMRANTDGCRLCHSGRDESADPGMKPLMWTDSETLMREGIALGKEAFLLFLEEMQWKPEDIHKTFCHQVGKAHQKLLFDTLGLNQQIDYATFEFLGNTGTVALPTAAAIGIEQGRVRPGDNVAMMGIGSGINVIILGVRWGGIG